MHHVIYKQEENNYKKLQNVDNVDDNVDMDEISMNMEEYEIGCGKIVIKQIGNVHVNVFCDEEVSPSNDMKSMLNGDVKIGSWGIVNIYIQRDSAQAHDDLDRDTDATVAKTRKSEKNQHVPIGSRSQEMVKIIEADHDLIQNGLTENKKCHIRCCVIL